MNNTQKNLSRLLGIGLVALLGNSALAHEQPGECGHSWNKGYGMQVEPRMAALHSALKLSASQEAAWTEFSEKMKPVRMDTPKPKNLMGMSTPDRLDQMLENMKTHEKRMAEHAATVRAFYDTLTQVQKKVFDTHFQERQNHRSPDKM